MTTPAKAILLVEDEAILALDEAKQLKGLGYGVTCAYRAEQAVNMVRERPDAFDLVLMDIDLGPGMDGVQAAHRILAERDIPVVFLSSHTEPEVVEKTEKVTSYGYVVKDSGLTVLAASIKMAFKLHRAYRELARQEEDLRESRERFSNAFEYAPIGMALVSPEGRWLKVNRSLCEIVGYPEEELLGLTFQDITHADDLEADLSFVHDMLAGKISTYQMPKRYLHKSGRLVWALLSVSVIRDKKEQPLYFISQVEDITERQQVHEQLVIKEAALESSMSAIGLADLAGKLIYANPAYIKLWGYERADEILGMPITAFAVSEEQVREVVATLKAGRTYVGEGVSRRTDGTEFIVQLSANLVTSPEGRPICMMASFLDITARKRTEAALHEMSEVFRLFMEHNPIYVYIKDADGRYVYISRNYEKLLARPESEIVGKTMGELFPPEFTKLVVADDLRVLREGSSVGNMTEVLGDRTYSTIKFPILIDGAPKYLAGYSIDITDQKKAEAGLIHSRDLLAYIISHARSAIAVHDRDMRYIYVSEQYLKEYKVQEQNVIGRHHYEVFPDLPQKWRDVHQRALAGEVSGSERDPYVRADGSVEWTRWECRPWYEAGGAIGGIIIYTEVITDRVRAEEALLQAVREKDALMMELQHRVKP